MPRPPAVKSGNIRVAVCDATHSPQSERAPAEMEGPLRYAQTVCRLAPTCNNREQRRRFQPVGSASGS